MSSTRNDPSLHSNPSENQSNPTRPVSIVEAEGDELSQNQRPPPRRIRNSTGERDYICGCSKAYLSYAAIYTHVRNKHGGIFPRGTVMRNRNSYKSGKPYERDCSDKAIANLGSPKSIFEEEAGGFSSILPGLKQLFEYNELYVEAYGVIFCNPRAKSSSPKSLSTSSQEGPSKKKTTSKLF